MVSGQVIEVVLAKPQTDKKSDHASNSYRAGQLPTYPQYPSYAYGGDPYAGYGGGYGAAAGQVLLRLFQNGIILPSMMFLFSLFVLWLISMHFCGLLKNFWLLVLQPVICGRGPMPAGMRMVPMVLPDGRIGYVL